MDRKHANCSNSPAKTPSAGEGAVTFTRVTDKTKPKA